MPGDASATSSGAALAPGCEASRSSSSGSLHLVDELRSELTRTKSQLALALGELQQLRAASSSQDLALLDRGNAEQPPMPLIPHPKEPWWNTSWQGFYRGFRIGYGVSAGLSLATKIFSVLRKGRISDLASWNILSESSLIYRVEAVRLGLFCGGYSAVYHAAIHWLTRLTEMDEVKREAVAGALAGLTVMFQSEDKRRTLALYTLARVAQCTYNTLKKKGKWHFWGSDWPHGDWLLFGASTAQIMYAYVQRPETLPTGYWNFIVNAGPIHKTVLKAVKATNDGNAVDVEAVTQYCIDAAKKAGIPPHPPLLEHPGCIPCGVLHPHASSCVPATAAAGASTFRKTFPLYMSISLVPYCVFNMGRALKDPGNTVLRALLGAVRSTAFLATFVSSFQATVCTQRSLSSQGADSGLVYMLAGFIASLSLLIEKKSRRSELALYVMPRALDSLFLTLTHDSWVPSIHLGEVALFSACMGALMHFHNREPDTMAPLVRSLITRIVFNSKDGSSGGAPGQQPPPPQLTAAAAADGDAASSPERAQQQHPPEESTGASSSQPAAVSLLSEPPSSNSQETSPTAEDAVLVSPAQGSSDEDHHSGAVAPASPAANRKGWTLL